MRKLIAAIFVAALLAPTGATLYHAKKFSGPVINPGPKTY